MTTVLTSFRASSIAVAQVLVLAGIGYWLARLGRLNRELVKGISSLLTDVFLPAFIFYHTCQGFPRVGFTLAVGLPLLGIAMLLGSLGLSWAIAKGLRLRNPSVFSAVVSFQNCGYMPLIMGSVLLSSPQVEVFYVWVFLFIVGFNLLVWSLGVVLISGSRSGLPLSRMFNLPFVTTVLAICVAGLGWDRFVPEFAWKTLEILSRPVLPLSMLVMGGILGMNCMRCNVDNKALVTAVVTKLVVIPVVVLLILRILPWDISPGLRWFVVLESAVPSAVSLVVISERYGGDTPFISQVLFYTHVFSLLTMPVILTLS